jgi:hypothetical protein
MRGGERTGELKGLEEGREGVRGYDLKNKAAARQNLGQIEVISRICHATSGQMLLGIFIWGLEHQCL